MTTSQKSKRHQEQAQSSSVMNAAEIEVGKIDDRSKKATSGVTLVMRACLFIAACIFAVLGVKGFIEATDVQSVSRMATVKTVVGEPIKHAIVVMSGDDSDATTALELDGVLDVLNRSGISSDVYYMRSAGDGDFDSADAELSATIYKKALSGTGCDAIVVAGDDALKFVSNHRDLFGAVPTTYFAVSSEDLVQSVRGQGIAAGTLEKGAAALSLSNMKTLVGSAKKAIVLVDGTEYSNGLLNQLRANTQAGLGLEREVWDVSKMTRSELSDKLGSLRNDSAVLLLSADRDSAGKVYSTDETFYFVSGATNVPVFSATGGVGEGVCGAAFFDRATEGSDAAKLVISMMNDKSSATAKVTEIEPVNSVYDASALLSHNLNPDATQSDSALINEPAFSMRVVRPLILPTVYLLLAVVFIMGFGVIGFRRSMQSNAAIVASRNDLQYRLYHDLLTNLPNRHAVENYVSNPDLDGKIKSMMHIDINGFTDVNDSYGHAFGDKVIVIVGKRLGNVKAQLMARSGSDEFVLIFDHALTVNSQEISHVTRIFDDPVVIRDNKVDITASIGVVNREEGAPADDLIALSEMALSVAKVEKATTPVFYVDEMRQDVERRLAITEYLKQAIAEERINVLWQPQVDTNTLKVYGYEALCRLEGNKYFPNDFIPVAEKSGLVNPLDRVVTKKVIEQMGVWLKEGRDVGVASINFSAAQLRDKGYCDFLADQLSVNKVSASLLKIEITESMILGNEIEAERLFSRLRSMGITLALDDFGTGYSSLSRMASRPVDFVKLDKSLVDAFMVPGKEGFIDDVTRLIHGIGKTIVVEGVETYEQYQMCQTLNCDIIQGYFFAKPMSAQEVAEFNPHDVIAKAKAESGDKTRNADWQKYDRDEHGRWKKS